MIEKIFIPTVHRVDNQITYNSLPEELKKRVVLVVQAWERDQYKYDCEYLVLPDESEFHYKDYYCLPRTRKVIYEAGKDIKYAMFDDDITFARRNSKYFSSINNMEKSKRISTHADITEMFSLFDLWLNNKDVTVCGCAQVENPPRNKQYHNNSSLSGALWINGNHFKNILSNLDLVSIRGAEDACFLLTLLSLGYGNRVSNEFVVVNNSVKYQNRIKSTLWDGTTFDKTHEEHKKMQEKFPGIFEILYDENNQRVSGGFRDYGKTKIQWSKAYKKSQTATLNNFFSK